jgi:hypothetical protein
MSPLLLCATINETVPNVSDQKGLFWYLHTSATGVPSGMSVNTERKYRKLAQRLGIGLQTATEVEEIWLDWESGRLLRKEA